MPAELDPDIEDLDDGAEPADPNAPVTPPTEPNADLKAAMVELAGTVKTLATPKPAVEPELTQEQKNKFWQVYDPEKSNKDFMKKWFRLNPEATTEEIAEVKTLWKEVQEGLVRQAVVGSQHLTSRELKKRDDRIDQLEAYVSERRAADTRSRFDTQFPSLADPRYSKIISIVARDLADKDFKNEGEYFQALADGAAETIKGVDTTFDLSAVKPKKPAGTSPRLPRTSVGGTGGTGNNGTQTALRVKGDATDEFLEEEV